MNVVYQHTQAVHSLRGAVAGFRYLSAYGPFRSLLDVGAGTGTWMAAACLAGIRDIWGIDAAEPAYRESLIQDCKFEIRDLSQPLNLNRTFDCITCLEVAEHLDESSAKTLVASLCRHGNLVFFSAAMPGQAGQHHVNCQWPCYWQDLFNAQGFACTDDVRWSMWRDTEIEAWYRQNIFRAIHDPNLAGSEPRIASVVHPDMLNPAGTSPNIAAESESRLRSHLPRPLRAIVRKAMRHLL